MYSIYSYIYIVNYTSMLVYFCRSFGNLNLSNTIKCVTCEETIQYDVYDYYRI